MIMLVLMRIVMLMRIIIMVTYVDNDYDDSKSCEKQVNDLLANYQPAQHSNNLRHIIDETNTLFAKTMRIALRDPILRKTVKQDRAYLDLLKVAMETYVMHSVYKKVFKVISSLFANEDAALNKTTRNLSDLQVKDLGIRNEFTMNVPRARRELANLNDCKTPLEKLHCLRRTIMGISQPNMKTKLKRSDQKVVLSSDDLLPILVFLVVKSEIPNWLTSLAYLHNFRFSSIHNDEFGFYLASIEAAVEHVKSGDMDGLPLGPANTKKLSIFSMSPTNIGGIWPRVDANEIADTPSVDLLFAAVRQGRIEEVEKLLNLGSSDYGHVTEEMCHPLCACDHCEKLLINKRNDPKAVTAFSRDDRGCTALHVAASFGHDVVMDILIQKGAIINATDYHGSTPLHLACQKGQQAATLLLLHHGAEVNADDNDGNTALHLCSANGHEECVKAILYSEQGLSNVEVNFPNCRGNTALHDAARWGYENIVKILLEHGASVEARNRRKETPLMSSLNVNVSKLLVRAAEIVRDGQEYMIIMSASQDGHQTLGGERKSLATPLRRRQGGLKISPQQRAKEMEKLLRAAADGDVQMVRHHLGWESDSDDSDVDDVSPNLQLCHPLCQCNKCSALQKRTSCGVGDITVNTSDVDGFTPLHVSALHGHEALVSLFLRRGANPNCRSSYQQVTPLHSACKENQPKIVHILLEHGAKCNSKDTNGNSPLHCCAMAGHLKCTTVLVEHGANVKQFNARGNIPLHEAARNNFVEIVKVLADKAPSTVLARNKAQLTPIQLAQNSDVSAVLKAANETYQEKMVMAPVAARPSTLVPSSPIKKVTMSQLFKAFNQADLLQHEALKHSLETFNKRKQLKRTESMDRSAPLLDINLKHQINIQRFNRRRLRHIELEDRTLQCVSEVPRGFHNDGVLNDGVHNDGVHNDGVLVNDIDAKENSSIKESGNYNQQVDSKEDNIGTQCDISDVPVSVTSSQRNHCYEAKVGELTVGEQRMTSKSCCNVLRSVDVNTNVADGPHDRNDSSCVVDRTATLDGADSQNGKTDCVDTKDEEVENEERRIVNVDLIEELDRPREMVDLAGSVHSDSAPFNLTHRRCHSNVSVEDMAAFTMDMRDNYFHVDSDEDERRGEEKRNWDKDRPGRISLSTTNVPGNAETNILLDNPLTDSDVDNMIEN